MKCAAALSTLSDTRSALAEVAKDVSESLGTERADLGVIFISMHHAPELGWIAAECRRRGLGDHIVGCTGESIVGPGQEVENQPALCLWSLHRAGIQIRPHRLEPDLEQFDVPPSNAQSTLLLLGDPFSFPTDEFLKRLNQEKSGLRVFGGMASGANGPGRNRLVLNEAVYQDGAVAIEFVGPLAVRSVVSQGCRPIGRSMVVTRSDQNLIQELGRRPALEVLREIYASLSPADQELVQQGLHVGRVINEYQESFRRGDFLVRNVIGADESGAIAITDSVRVGQTVQFHVRDAGTADEDLSNLLETERADHPGGRVKGALLFSCNGRGTRLFAEPNHDTNAISVAFGPIPVAGFFAMGELGPIGEQNFVHGFTASIVLFEDAAAE